MNSVYISFRLVCFGLPKTEFHKGKRFSGSPRTAWTHVSVRPHGQLWVWRIQISGQGGVANENNLVIIYDFKRSSLSSYSFPNSCGGEKKLLWGDGFLEIQRGNFCTNMICNFIIKSINQSDHIHFLLLQDTLLGFPGGSLVLKLTPSLLQLLMLSLQVLLHLLMTPLQLHGSQGIQLLPIKPSTQSRQLTHNAQINQRAKREFGKHFELEWHFFSFY